ncbi:uncharacterized protein I206_100165 [Kwoniella pini CBS 10737]|uniref:Uncharacterized protein n=1 Tax=Kwoniella pini CBS 10737 TaxID=1296096 RepID=A0A1B9IE74_9TREE|nr:uncharacterized protein I206_01163 [Kwoniella pini CBS 10737]OCF53856.1 hypothetical protein I206_01163 [Kwoniella pini CBS 10737]
MPRISYEQHLIEKAINRENERRRGSIIESETDAESLFSSTTFQSHSSSSHYINSRISSSSYYTSSSLNNNYLYPNSYKPIRSFSSTSYESNPSTFSTKQKDRSRSISPSNRIQNSIPIEYSPLVLIEAETKNDNENENENNKKSLFGEMKKEIKEKTTFLNVPSSSSSYNKKEEKKEKKKQKNLKLEKSTLFSKRFNSPLRILIRWMNHNGFYNYTIISSLIFIFIIKLNLILIFQNSFNLNLSIEWNWLLPFKLFTYGLIKRRLIEEMMWIMVIYFWTKEECKKTGRSKRSQVIAIVTILLSPISLISDRTPLPMSMIIYPLILLSARPSMDVYSAGMIAVSLTVVHFHSVWATGIAFYLLGKGIWIGGLEGARFLFLNVVISAVIMSTRPILCESELLGNLLSKLRISKLPFSKLPIPTTVINLLQEGSRILEGSHGNYCQATKPFPALSTIAERLLNHKIKFLITILSIIPPLTILLYSNISLRPGNVKKASSTITLLPYFLFLISIPVYLFSNDKDGQNLQVILPLLPITLLMSLRGSAAKGSAQGGSQIEDEVWKVGVVLNVVGVINLIPIQASIAKRIIFSLVAIMWITLIGASPWLAGLIVARQISIVLIPSTIFLAYVQPVESVVMKGIFALAWFWGMKKLIQNAWAMGGLSGNGRKRVERRKGQSKEKAI